MLVEFKNLSILITHSLRLLSTLVVFSLLIIIAGCSEREHNNPFDTNAQNNPPLTLSISSADNAAIQLSWQWAIEPIADYSGFRIYRSVDSQNFTLYREIPKGQFSLVDSPAQTYHWYYYRVSVYGPGVESVASQNQKIFLGQGVYWILSKYGFWIRKVSYDLQRTLNHYDTTYPPDEWGISLSDSLVWLGFTLYGQGVSSLNLKTAMEDFIYFGNLNSPVDVEYNPQQNRAFALDEGTRDKIIIFQNKALQSSISLPQGNYFKLFLSNPNQQLIILGEKKCLKLSLSSMTVTDSLLFAANQTGRDMDASSDSIFILTSSAQGSGAIYKLSFSDMSPNISNVNGQFYRITYNSQSDEFYLAENVPSAPDRVVKLSAQGSRLLQLSGFEYIEQVGLNPYDQSIVVVDRLGDRLFLFDSNGNEVGRSGQNAFYDPIRIFIE